MSFNGPRSRTAIERADLEHLGDRSHAGDWFFRELADAEGNGSREFAVQVDGAAAHSSDYAVIDCLGAAEANQDYIAFGAIGILQDTEHLNVHGFGLCALEYGVGDAVHSGVDLLDGDGFNWLGSLGWACERQYTAKNYKGENCSSGYT